MHLPPALTEALGSRWTQLGAEGGVCSKGAERARSLPELLTPVPCWRENLGSPSLTEAPCLHPPGCPGPKEWERRAGSQWPPGTARPGVAAAGGGLMTTCQCGQRREPCHGPYDPRPPLILQAGKPRLGWRRSCPLGGRGSQSPHENAWPPGQVRATSPVLCHAALDFGSSPAQP